MTSEFANARKEIASYASRLFWCAWTLRVVVAIAARGEGIWDAHYYEYGAERIAAGFGYTDSLQGGSVLHPWCHYPVGYSAFLAMARVLGHVLTPAAFESVVDPYVFPIANAFVGAALVSTTYRFAAHTLTQRRAKLAGWIALLHPGLILYSAISMSEPLAALLVVYALECALRPLAPLEPGSRIVRKPTLRWPAFVLGLAALVRPQALLFLPVLWALPLLSAPPAEAKSEFSEPLFAAESSSLQRWRTRFRTAVTTCIFAFLPILPWTLRNCQTMDACVLISTNTGWNLAIGSSPRATGRFETLRATDGCDSVRGQVEQDRCWFQKGLSFIQEDPQRFLSLVPKKLSFTFDHESFPVEYLFEAKRPPVWTDSVREKARSFLSDFHRVLVAFAACSILALRANGRKDRESRRAQLSAFVLTLLVAGTILLALRSDPPAWTLVVLAGSLLAWIPVPSRVAFPNGLRWAHFAVLTTAVLHAVFFGEDRYHVPLIPFWTVLAAAAFRIETPRPQEDVHL